LKKVVSAEVAARGFKFKFDLSKLGEPGGVTLADAFTEVVEQSRTDLVVIVDEVQQCLASDDGLSMMLALKAARDAINLRPNPLGHFVFIGTGSNRALVQELSREPTSEEIAKRMDIPVSKVRKVLKIAQEPISLETPIGEEEDSHLGDFIEDRQVVSPAEAVINLNLKEQTESVLKTLTPREEKVIKMRFGVGDGSEHTLEEVGQSFAVTRERIRQIEAKALRKLRHPSRSRKLRAFLEGRTT